jgi:hypothetical protein
LATVIAPGLTLLGHEPDHQVGGIIRGCGRKLKTGPPKYVNCMMSNDVNMTLMHAAAMSLSLFA